MSKINKEHQIRKELEEVEKSSDEKNFNKEIDNLKFKLQELEDIQRDNYDNLEKLSHLYKLGIIDEEGFPMSNRME